MRLAEKTTYLDPGGSVIEWQEPVLYCTEEEFMFLCGHPKCDCSVLWQQAQDVSQRPPSPGATFHEPWMIRLAGSGGRGRSSRSNFSAARRGAAEVSAVRVTLAPLRFMVNEMALAVI